MEHCVKSNFSIRVSDKDTRTVLVENILDIADVYGSVGAITEELNQNFGCHDPAVDDIRGLVMCLQATYPTYEPNNIIIDDIDQVSGDFIYLNINLMSYSNENSLCT